MDLPGNSILLLASPETQNDEFQFQLKLQVHLLSPIPIAIAIAMGIQIPLDVATATAIAIHEFMNSIESTGSIGVPSVPPKDPWAPLWDPRGLLRPRSLWGSYPGIPDTPHESQGGGKVI